MLALELVGLTAFSFHIHPHFLSLWALDSPKILFNTCEAQTRVLQDVEPSSGDECRPIAVSS